MGSSNENSAFGPVHNPWDLDAVPGGVIGRHRAAAVASGEVVWALGTDTGGSVRQPASLTGVVGLKPTYGLISRYGLIAFASSPGHGRDLHAQRPRRGVAAGRRSPARTAATPRAWTLSPRLSRRDSTTAWTGCGSASWPRRSARACEPDVAASVRAAVERLAGDGRAGRRGACSRTPSTRSRAYYLIAPSEASSNLARYDGVRYGLREEGADSIEMMFRTRGAGFGPEVKRRIMLGTYALSAGYYDAYYGQAQKVRTLVIRDYEAGLRRLRRPRLADVAHHGVPDRREGRRPAWRCT